MSYSPIMTGAVGETPPQDILDQWCYQCDEDQYLVVPADDQEPTSCSGECPSGWSVDMSEYPCTTLCIEPDAGEPAAPPVGPSPSPSPATRPSGSAAPSTQQAAAAPSPQASQAQTTQKDNTGLVAAAIVVGSVLLAYLAW